MRAFWYRFACDEEAATAVEYAVMLALILISIISAISVVGGETFVMWGNIQHELNAHGF